jgi:hypothetical protein
MTVTTPHRRPQVKFAVRRFREPRLLWVYSGQEMCGSILEEGTCCIARNVADQEIGRYPTRREAFHAVQTQGAAP